MPADDRGLLRLRFSGVVSVQSPDFKKRLSKFNNASADVLLDLNEVITMESAALASLLRTRAKREKQGRNSWIMVQLPTLKRILNVANVPILSGPALELVLDTANAHFATDVHNSAASSD